MKNAREVTDEEWKEKLSKEEYRVLREKGTERAFTGQYWKHKEKGTYKCVGCGVELFSLMKNLIRVVVGRVSMMP